MNEKTLKSLNEFLIALNNDERIIELKKKEENLSSKEVEELSKKMNLASSLYEEDLSRYGFSSPLSIENRKKLHEAKLELDSNEKVKEYMRSYLKVKELYSKIDEIIFSSFRNKDKYKC